MSQYTKYSASGGGGGSGTWQAPVANAAALPPTGNTAGDARVASDTGVIYVWDGVSWTSPSGSGTVTSVGMSVPSILAVSGSPITGAGTLAVTLAIQPAKSVLAGPVSGPNDVPTFRALENTDLPTGNFNVFAGYDSSGILGDLTAFQVDNVTGGVNQYNLQSPNNTTGYLNVNNQNVDVNPTVNSPNTTYAGRYLQMRVGADNAGFSLGTNGDAIVVDNLFVNVDNLSSAGGISLRRAGVNFGNGTNPVSINSLNYSNAFASIANNATVTGQVRGYGFEPNAAAGSAILGSVAPFYDFSNFAIALSGYDGVNVSPNISSISAGGYFNGLRASPNITLNRGNVTGLSVSVDNVTNYAGVQASRVVQDITYTIVQAGSSANATTVQYVNTVTAGNESFSFGNQVITVAIESGVSTATQIHAAAIASIGFSNNVTTVITGVGSNAQTSTGTLNFTGGIDPGTKVAAQFNGDVQINGGLSFTGGVSLGALDSFATAPLVDGGGTPTSISTIITQPTVAANVTVANADLLGVNTAMLLDIGDNATVTTAFLGVSALGLPAVVTMGVGSTVDRVAGATFAISLDSDGTGGTVDTVALCRALALPNGVTTVNKLRGYEFDLPFGDPGTITHGIWAAPDVHNYLGGRLKVGGGSDVENASAVIEIESTTRGFLNARMTTAQRNAIAAVNGLQIYNTTTDKLQVYAAGVWVDLH